MRPFGIERSGVPGREAAESNAERAMNASAQALGRRIDSVSATIAYSAAVPADWSGTPPASIAEALDRLAALVGPVP